MAATLKDIAKRTGLSVPSVCLILNGQGHKFRPESVDAVRLAAAELRYRPDMVMRRKGQAASRHDAIGVLLHTDAPAQTANQPAHELIWGINNILLQHDQLMAFAALTNSYDNPKTPRILSERFIDGLIVVGSNLPPKLIQQVDHFQIHTVWLNTERRLDHDCVHTDDAHAGRVATEHLLGLNHRHVLFAHNTWQHAAGNQAGGAQSGYAAALQAAGVTTRIFDPQSIPAADRNDGLVPAILDTIARSRKGAAPITAVVVASMPLTIKLIESLPTRGLTCPEDLSVVSACDLKLFQDNWSHLTRVSCDRTLVGSAAAEMILSKITALGTPQPSRTFLGSLVPGSTTRRIA